MKEIRPVLTSTQGRECRQKLVDCGVRLWDCEDQINESATLLDFLVDKGFGVALNNYGKGWALIIHFDSVSKAGHAVRNGVCFDGQPYEVVRFVDRDDAILWSASWAVGYIESLPEHKRLHDEAKAREEEQIRRIMEP